MNESNNRGGIKGRSSSVGDFARQCRRCSNASSIEDRRSHIYQSKKIRNKHSTVHRRKTRGSAKEETRKYDSPHLINWRRECQSKCLLCYWLARLESSRTKGEISLNLISVFTIRIFIQQDTVQSVLRACATGGEASEINSLNLL